MHAYPSPSTTPPHPRPPIRPRVPLFRCLLAVLLCGAFSALTAHAQPGPTPASPPTSPPTQAPSAASTSSPTSTAKPRATASRGVTGEFIFEYAGPVLRARPNQALTSPMLVRLALLNQNEPLAPGAGRKYRLSFIGAVAGVFDLREYLERADGQAITDLPALTVSVVSQLPEKHGTDLFTARHPPFLLESHYRTLLFAFAALWIGIPLFVVVRRALRKHNLPPEPVAPPPPTLAEQLRPLVEAAANRDLSIAEQGRLELLLISFWRERLGLASLSPAQAIGRIRSDPTAGQLLIAVERWLHSRDSGSARPTPDIAALLLPYRSVPAVEPAQVPSSGRPDAPATSEAAT